MLLGATACSDDHFDIKELPGAEGSAATIWQSIKANPELSDVAEILAATRVMKDEKDSKATLKYSEWLDQPMAATAWFPKNGTFDKQQYLDLLKAAEDLANENNKAEALRTEYQVVNQFVKNHIALFNYGSTSTVQNVRLLNSKLSKFDAVQAMFNGTSIDLSATVHTGNGALYVLNGVSPFAYNIYDYMSTNENFSKVYSIISDPSIDKDTFWPEGSTQGGMNENGEIVYVDSVFLNSNQMLSNAGALIKSEDSLYVAMIPSNAAWEETYNVVKPLFEYGDTYNYDWVDGKFQKKGPDALKFTASQRDSLQNLNTNASIIEGMFFNPNTFRENSLPVSTDSADLFKFMLYDADSLISTNGTIYYNENANTGLPNPLFADLIPIKASNGYIFAPENNRIKPEYSFIRRYEYRPGSILAYLTGCKTPAGELVNLTVDNWQKDIVQGSVEDDKYHYFEMSGISTLKIKMRLNNLPCGHYKIYAQMLPNRINSDKLHFEDDGVTPLVETPKFTADMYLDDTKKAVPTAKNLTVSQDLVQNVVLFEDFELKKSFMRLPAGYETFPSLEISMQYNKKSNCTALSIAKIVVEPIRK